LLTFLNSCLGSARSRDGSRRASRHFGSAPAAVEPLETRVLPAVTLLIDYSLDTTNFLRGNAERQAALNSVATEIGSRLNDTLVGINDDPRVPKVNLSFTNPVTNAPFQAQTTSAANTILIYAGGRAFDGSQVGEGGWRTSSRRSAVGDFQPYAGYLAFDTTGTTWDFSGAGAGTDFKAVARHELLHVLGLDHMAQTADSIMRPAISEIRSLTNADWSALSAKGWQVTATPASGTYADVIARTSGGTWQVSRNLGDTLSPPTTLGRWAETAGWKDVSTGDFDGDGRTDVVGRTSAGEWYVGLNRHGLLPDLQLGLVNRRFGRWNEQAVWQDVRFGDFNADGKTDVAGRASNGEWYVGLSTGTSFTTTRWTRWKEAAEWRDVRIGDFDGDRRADIAGRSSAGEWYVARSTGAAFDTRFWTRWNEQAGWQDVLVADFDGNGRADIAGRTSGGEWYVGRSIVGNIFLTTRWDVWSNAVDWRSVTVGNFAGDSRPDLVGRTATGQWYVAVNTAGLTFGTIPYGAWTETTWRTVLVGDFAGSAATADILARSSAGTWFLGQNTGSQFVFRPFGQWNEGLAWRDVAASKRAFTTGAGAAGFGPAPGLSVTGLASTSAPAGLMTRSLLAESDAPVAEAEEIAPSAARTQPSALAPPKEDDPVAGDPLAGVVPPASGMISPLDAAFGDVSLLDALVAAA